MAVASPVFFDTSVLLAGLIELRPRDTDPAQRIMQAVADKRVRRPQTAWHCCLEFYAVATRLPEEFRLAPGDALRLLEEEIFARFEVHQLEGSAHLPFLRSAEHDRVVGGRIYDAHIGEIARRAGVRLIVTDNRRHFTALLSHGVQVLGSATFAEEL